MQAGRWRVGSDCAGLASGAFTQSHVRPPQCRFDTRSYAIAACVVDFKRQKKDQRGLKGRSLVTVSPICSALKFRARDDLLQDAVGRIFHERRCHIARSMQAQKRSKRMSSGWQPIVTAPKNDERILVSGGTWIRGNKQTLPQSFPCLVIWDETDWLICDNEGPRALIRGPKFWMAIPPTLC